MCKYELLIHFYEILIGNYEIIFWKKYRKCHLLNSVMCIDECMCRCMFVWLVVNLLLFCKRWFQFFVSFYFFHKVSVTSS